MHRASTPLQDHVFAFDRLTFFFFPTTASQSPPTGENDDLEPTEVFVSSRQVRDPEMRHVLSLPRRSLRLHMEGATLLVIDR